MKKAFILFLLPVFLLTTTVGVTILSHYCGGKLVAKGLSVKPCCKDVNKGGCCKTESVSFKITDSFLKTSHDVATAGLLAVLSDFTQFILPAALPNSIAWKACRDHAPPDSGTPRYLKYRALLI